MKRLLLVMGGCSAKSVDDVKTVEWKDTVVRDGLRYEVEGMTHVTGTVILDIPPEKRKGSKPTRVERQMDYPLPGKRMGRRPLA